MEEAILFTCGLITLGAAAAIQRAQRSKGTPDGKLAGIESRNAAHPANQRAVAACES